MYLWFSIKKKITFHKIPLQILLRGMADRWQSNSRAASGICFEQVKLSPLDNRSFTLLVSATHKKNKKSSQVNTVLLPTFSFPSNSPSTHVWCAPPIRSTEMTAYKDVSNLRYARKQNSRRDTFFAKSRQL